MKITKLLKSEQPVTVLLYGGSGVGKTTIAGTATQSPEVFGDVLFLDVDGGLSVISDNDNSYVVRITGIRDMVEVLSALTAPEKRKPEEFRNVKTVVFDSLTAFKSVSLAEVAKKSAAKNKRPDAFTQHRGDWMTTGNQITNLLLQLKSAGYNIIATAEETVVRNEHGHVLEVIPALNPSLASGIVYMFSCVWRVTSSSKTEDRALQLYGNPSVPCVNKTRGTPEDNRMLVKLCNKKGQFVVPNYYESDDLHVLPFLTQALNDPTAVDALLDTYNYEVK